MADRLWRFNPGCPTEVCCGEEESFPNCMLLDGVDLFLTDSNGTFPMVWNSGVGSDSYYVTYQFNPPTSVSIIGGICVRTTPGDLCSVLYELGCFTSGGVTYAELSMRYAVNNDPCGGSAVHPYQVFQISTSHPSGHTWPGANAGRVMQQSYPLPNPNVLEFTFPSTGDNGPPFHDWYDNPAPGLVSITL